MTKKALPLRSALFKSKVVVVENNEHCHIPTTSLYCNRCLIVCPIKYKYVIYQQKYQDVVTFPCW
jgi:hypothetical protein